jgi:four helix bundle protein
VQARSIEEFEAWQQAVRFVAALSAAVREGSLSRDFKLRGQIDDCADSILSNLAEGFEQGTDRAFARYVLIARGSCSEAWTHLAVAQMRGHLPAAVVAELRKDGEHASRLMTGLINYLYRSDRKRRR